MSRRVDMSRADALRVYTGINDYVAQHPDEFRKSKRPGCGGLLAALLVLVIVIGGVL